MFVGLYVKDFLARRKVERYELMVRAGAHLEDQVFSDEPLGVVGVIALSNRM